MALGAAGRCALPARLGSWEGSLNAGGTNVFSEWSENPLSPFFVLCFAFPEGGRRNVSATGCTMWLFVVGFFVNYVTVNIWV